MKKTITIKNPAKKGRVSKAVKKTKRRKKNPVLPKEYKRRVKHRPVTYGTKTEAGWRSPYKKLNPKKRSKKVMARKRKRVKRRTVYRNPVIKRVSRRRSVRRNPSGNIFNMFANGALGGVAALGSLFISKHLSPMITKDITGTSQKTQTTRNIIQLLIATGVGYVAHRFLDRDKADAVSTGVIASVVMLTLNSAFGLSLLAGESSDIDAIVDSISGDIYDDVAGELSDETSLLGLLEGESFDDPALLGLLEGDDDDISGLLEGDDEYSFAGIDEDYQ